MNIEHVALWTQDLERSRRFYERYFGGRAGARYDHAEHHYASYFVAFSDGSRLELMQMPGVAARRHDDPARQYLGWAHLAFGAATDAEVDALTLRLRTDGFTVIGEPRRTGDGYYESVVLDPDGNRIEITALPASALALAVTAAGAEC